MIYAWYWTLVTALGLIGAAKNLRNRQDNISALKAWGMLGKEYHIAKVFRNSEFFRVGQALIMFAVGAIIIYIHYWPTAPGAHWLATHFYHGYSISFCLMATLAAINIWYFGTEGRILMGNHRKGRVKR